MDVERVDAGGVASTLPSSERIEARRRYKLNPLALRLVTGDGIALSLAWAPQALLLPRGAVALRVASAVGAAAATLIVIERAGLCRSPLSGWQASEFSRILVAALIGGLAFAAIGGMGGAVTVAGAVEGGLAAAVGLLLRRWLFACWLKSRQSAGQFLREVVLIGANEDAVALCTTLTNEPELGYRVVAVAGEPENDVPWGLPRCVDMEDLGRFATRLGATGVIVVANALRASATATAMRDALAAGLDVQIWPGLSRVFSNRLRLTPIQGVPLFSIEPHHVARWQLIAKRAMDVTVAVTLGLAASPLMLLAAALVKLQDGGSILIRSERVGRFGAPITVFKLRTMVPNAAKLQPEVAALNERTGGPLFKASNDPRVTKIGRALRATSIDELPQLWNVLNGTMSLVGPRPALPAEAKQFDAELNRRHEMRPGITGLWQAEARDNPSFNAYRRLDLSYIENWTLSLDCSIIAITVHAVIARACRAIFLGSSRAT